MILVQSTLPVPDLAECDRHWQPEDRGQFAALAVSVPCWPVQELTLPTNLCQLPPFAARLDSSSAGELRKMQRCLYSSIWALLVPPRHGFSFARTLWNACTGSMRFSRKDNPPSISTYPADASLRRFSQTVHRGALFSTCEDVPCWPKRALNREFSPTEFLDEGVLSVGLERVGLAQRVSEDFYCLPPQITFRAAPERMVVNKVPVVTYHGEWSILCGYAAPPDGLSLRYCSRMFKRVS